MVVGPVHVEVEQLGLVSLNSNAYFFVNGPVRRVIDDVLVRQVLDDDRVGALLLLKDRLLLGLLLSLALLVQLEHLQRVVLRLLVPDLVQQEVETLLAESRLQSQRVGGQPDPEEVLHDIAPVVVELVGHVLRDLLVLDQFLDDLVLGLAGLDQSVKSQFGHVVISRLKPYCFRCLNVLSSWMVNYLMRSLQGALQQSVVLLLMHHSMYLFQRFTCEWRPLGSAGTVLDFGTGGPTSAGLCRPEWRKAY